MFSLQAIKSLMESVCDNPALIAQMETVVMPLLKLVLVHKGVEDDRFNVTVGLFLFFILVVFETTNKLTIR